MSNFRCKNLWRLWAVLTWCIHMISFWISKLRTGYFLYNCMSNVHMNGTVSEWQYVCWHLNIHVLLYMYTYIIHSDNICTFTQALITQMKFFRIFCNTYIDGFHPQTIFMTMFISFLFNRICPQYLAEDHRQGWVGWDLLGVIGLGSGLLKLTRD